MQRVRKGAGTLRTPLSQMEEEEDQNDRVVQGGVTFHQKQSWLLQKKRMDQTVEKTSSLNKTVRPDKEIEGTVEENKDPQNFKVRKNSLGIVGIQAGEEVNRIIKKQTL